VLASEESLLNQGWLQDGTSCPATTGEKEFFLQTCGRIRDRPIRKGRFLIGAPRFSERHDGEIVRWSFAVEAKPQRQCSGIIQCAARSQVTTYTRTKNSSEHELEKTALRNRHC